LYVIFHPEVHIGKYILIGLGVLFILLWNYLGKIKQNFFIGIKLPRTLSDEDVWNKTSRFWGKLLAISWLFFLLGGILERFSIRMILLPIISIVVFPALYSYLLFKKKHHR
jgi:uncharacterized membrane protein